MGYRGRTVAPALLLLVLLAPVALGAQAGEVLNNEAIVQMIASKVPKDLITTKIRTTKSAYDISAAGLVTLQASKVPTDIVKMMMTASNAAPKETLTNDPIVQMVNGSVPRDVIVTKIQMSRADYDLTSNGVIALTNSKVSQDIIKAMMAAASGTGGAPSAGGSSPATAAPPPPPPPPAAGRAAGRRGGGGAL